jgi:hypothetical protein
VNRLRIFAAAILLFTSISWGECKEDHRSNKHSGILITDFIVSGSITVGAATLTRIRSGLIGTCVDNDAETAEEVVRAAFQNAGYFAVSVTNVTIKPGDALAMPKPAVLEAQVEAGAKNRLGELKFLGNHAFGTERLQRAFPIKKGDVFERGKVTAGLERLRKVYSRKGYLDFVCMPETSFTGHTVSLTVTVEEGQQYRMGKLKVYAKRALADELTPVWRLREGGVFDFGYLQKFVDTNYALLPDDFTTEHIRLVRDCPEATVAVFLIIDQTDPSAQLLPASVECERPKDDSQFPRP